MRLPVQLEGRVARLNAAGDLQDRPRRGGDLPIRQKQLYRPISPKRKLAGGGIVC